MHEYEMTYETYDLQYLERTPDTPPLIRIAYEPEYISDAAHADIHIEHFPRIAAAILR